MNRVDKATGKKPLGYKEADLVSVEVIAPGRQRSAAKKTKKTSNWVPSGGPTRLAAGINDVYKEPAKLPIRRKIKQSRNSNLTSNSPRPKEESREKLLSKAVRYAS